MPDEQNISLVRTELDKLRPTQLTVGYAEVKLKAGEWARLKKKQLKLELEQHVFPAVLGPEHTYYITDHHHLGIALQEQGVKEVWVAQLDDLSYLRGDIFWRTLEFREWTHPYDRNGERRRYEDIPRRLSQLKNDPYRGLAGLVRLKGGYAKVATPFAEFLWADYFRPRLGVKQVERRLDQALAAGLKLAHSPEARYLPGWTGKLGRPAS